MVEAPSQENRGVLIFLIVTIFLICIAYTSRNVEEEEYFFVEVSRAVKGFIFYPVSSIWQGISTKAQSYLDLVHRVQDLNQDLLDTRMELLKYKGLYTYLENVLKEKHDYLEIRQKGKQIPHQIVVAKVLFKDPQNLFVSITIDKGSDHGIQVGQPVVAFEGAMYALVGKILEVYPKSSTVITIVDQRCRVGVFVQGMGDTAIMEGLAPISISLLVRYLDRNSGLDFQKRMVVTSDMGGKYPAGIPIGHIVKIKKERYGLFQSAEVTPILNFFRLRYVFVFQS